MLFKEITPVYSENHTEGRYSLWGENAEIFNIKSGGTYNNHCTSKVSNKCLDPMET
jgi:hypothetical protein